MAPRTTLVSRIQATRSNLPEETFVWSLNETADHQVEVMCEYGGGESTNNSVVATIPMGSPNAVPIRPLFDPDIQVTGTVSAIWFGDGSYAVCFDGSMVRRDVVRIIAGPVVVGVVLNGARAQATGQR